MNLPKGNTLDEPKKAGVFTLQNRFHVGIMSASKERAHPSGAHYDAQLLVLLTNIRLTSKNGVFSFQNLFSSNSNVCG
jgi:hypothetical protein